LTVKADFGGSCQISSKDSDSCSDLAGAGLCFDKRSKSCRQPKDSTCVSSPSDKSCSIETPIGGLEQSRIGGVACARGSGAETVQSGQLACRSDFEQSPVACRLAII